MTTGESVSVNSQPICFSVHSDECGLLCNFFFVFSLGARSALKFQRYLVEHWQGNVVPRAVICEWTESGSMQLGRKCWKIAVIINGNAELLLREGTWSLCFKKDVQF